ncbi:hypothetical protein [Methyloceanibacter caenitepidi]|nr:hypothetical protein [Methyloceanibacter caenitepidi]
MKQIALFATAALVSLSVAGCAVEVPMSAFQLGPLEAEKAPAPASQPQRDLPPVR